MLSNTFLQEIQSSLSKNKFFSAEDFDISWEKDTRYGNVINLKITYRYYDKYIFDVAISNKDMNLSVVLLQVK